MDISQSLNKKIIDIVGKDFVFADKQDMVVYESDVEANADDEKPPNTTECTAPILAHANTAMVNSGTIGI